MRRSAGRSWRWHEATMPQVAIDEKATRDPAWLTMSMWIPAVLLARQPRRDPRARRPPRRSGPPPAARVARPPPRAAAVSAGAARTYARAVSTRMAPEARPWRRGAQLLVGLVLYAPVDRDARATPGWAACRGTCSRRGSSGARTCRSGPSRCWSGWSSSRAGSRCGSARGSARSPTSSSSARSSTRSSPCWTACPTRWPSGSAWPSAASSSTGWRRACTSGRASGRARATGS